MKKILWLLISGFSAMEKASAEIELGVASFYADYGVAAESEITPFIGYANDWFYLDASSVGVSLYETETDDELQFELLAYVSYERNGYALEDPDFALLKNSPEHSFDLGLELEITTPVGLLWLSAQHDVSATYHGQTASLAYAFPFDGEQWNFTPSIGIDYLSREFVDYYYGFAADPRSETAPQGYQGDVAFNPVIGYSFDYQLGQNLRFSHTLYYGLNASAIKNSPLADGRSYQEIEVFLSYVF